jgi:6-pyruvoyl-tetrahydropterin synthase
MKTELLLKFNFEASHSLEGFETPHPHLWRLEFAVEGESIQGRIIDLVHLRERVDQLIMPLKLTYLNENLFVTSEVRKYPTCETLSEYFSHHLQVILQHEYYPHNASIRLTSVLVAICEMDGTEMGAVRRSF